MGLHEEKVKIKKAMQNKDISVKDKKALLLLLSALLINLVQFHR